MLFTLMQVLCMHTVATPTMQIHIQARRQGGSDEPPRLPNGPLEVLRKLLYWPLLTPQIAVTSSVELKTAVIRLRTASLHRYAVDQCRHELFDSIDTPLINN